MPREIIRTIYSDDRRQRVCIFRRKDGTYGFFEEQFLDGPFEECWHLSGEHTESFCLSEEIVLREVTGRIDWLAETTAPSAPLSAHQDLPTVSRPPAEIDGAVVLYFAVINDDRCWTSNCRHTSGGDVRGPAAGLAICRYPGEPDCYLFGCDSEWNVISDTYHSTLDDAKSQAELEYAGITPMWKTGTEHDG
ncbi:MAG: hypothetical protein DWQ34_19675 [Planctomycetota bacterium]|nr:MAG: hypothetical protein DWQ34_19675 [Planctomycetota bacterium]REK28952.1 MAG: hypothetical protein DWQ41_05245 [Planctomycetota bacterium]REK39614.1 MAG: hypothetical protein DWQ45_01700 [Planctomycetota bacterium]